VGGGTSLEDGENGAQLRSRIAQGLDVLDNVRLAPSLSAALLDTILTILTRDRCKKIFLIVVLWEA
jgi:hypothetical protein